MTVYLSPQAQTIVSTPFPIEFAEGARSAVETCLRIQPNEKVTLITDQRRLQLRGPWRRS